ncbi:MAG TPA: vitamin K epoxide reductase family protein [Polyangiaceae bacterium]|jgi:hypothetical protein
MRTRELRWVAGLCLAGSVLGVIFAAYSTGDYMAHLDRQVHAVHCSFIPGANVSSDEGNPCKAALFSPFSAIFRQSFWGGIPISLGALGCFCFFVGLGLYLALAPSRAPRRSLELLGVTGFAPLGASLVMFVISLTQLHAFCKVCVGIYFSSALVALSAIGAWRALALERKDGSARPRGKPLVLAAGVGAFAIASLLPALVYASSLPDYRPYLTSCGALAQKTEPHDALVKIPTTQPKRKVLLFEDPLCPTCKAFHERLVSEGIIERLDITLSLFPLDTECNWMLDRSLHPGACVLSKAVICGKDRARAVLEWAYANQEDLRPLGKQGDAALKAAIVKQFGADVGACIDDKATGVRLNQELQFAASNHIPVSTPQMYMLEQDKLGRVCDEDTDLGLKYAMGQLAPEVLP